MKKNSRNSKTQGFKVRTAVSLNKTRPLRSRKIQKLQRNLKLAPDDKKGNTNSKAAAAQPSSPTINQSSSTRARPKQPSQLAELRRRSRWIWPARIAFFLNGIYFLAFALLSFVGLFSNYKVIKPLFILPFETDFSSFFLLEASALFAGSAGLLFLHAARHPQQYRWFYFLHIFLILPYHFCSNLLKMQIELPPDFQNYLYFDTIITVLLWTVYLISISTYIKSQPNSH